MIEWKVVASRKLRWLTNAHRRVIVGLTLKKRSGNQTGRLPRKPSNLNQVLNHNLSNSLVEILLDFWAEAMSLRRMLSKAISKNILLALNEASSSRSLIRISNKWTLLKSVDRWLGSIQMTIISLQWRGESKIRIYLWIRNSNSSTQEASSGSIQRSSCSSNRRWQ